MPIDIVDLARRKGIRRRVVVIPPIGPRKGTEEAIRRAAIHPLAAALREHRAALVRETLSDLVRDRLGDAMARFRQALSALLRSAEAMIERALLLESARHADRWVERVNAAIGIDIGAVVRSENIGQTIDLAVRHNVALIRGLGDDVSAKIERRLLEQLQRGAATKAIGKVLAEEFGFAKKRAARIARDQAAKFSADLNRIRQQQAGIDEYDWMCSLDERVRGNPAGRYPGARPSHWDRHGKRFRWDKRPSEGPNDGHPGEPVLCRCRARAVIRID